MTRHLAKTHPWPNTLIPNDGKCLGYDEAYRAASPETKTDLRERHRSWRKSRNRLASRRSALGAEIARQARMPDRRKGYFADTWRSSNLEKIQREVRQAVDTERRCRRDLRKLVKLVLRALDARRARVGPTS